MGKHGATLPPPPPPLLEPLHHHHLPPSPPGRHCSLHPHTQARCPPVSSVLDQVSPSHTQYYRMTPPICTFWCIAFLPLLNNVLTRDIPVYHQFYPQLILSSSSMCRPRHHVKVFLNNLILETYSEQLLCDLCMNLWKTM